MSASEENSLPFSLPVSGVEEEPSAEDSGKALVFEHFLTRTFRRQRGVVKHSSEHGIFVAFLLQDGELLFSAVIFARKAQKLEQKRAAADIGRIITEVSIQSRDSFGKLSGLE